MLSLFCSIRGYKRETSYLSVRVVSIHNGQIEFDMTLKNFITFELHNHYLYKYQVLCGFVLIIS